MKHLRLIHNDTGERAVYKLEGISEELPMMIEWKLIIPDYSKLFNNTIYLKPDYVTQSTDTFIVEYINKDEVDGEKFMDEI